MPSGGSSSSSSLTPQVHWAQRHRELYLRVELSDAQDPDIRITDNVLHFKAQGHGAKGDNVYEFQIEFLEPVKPQEVLSVFQEKKVQERRCLGFNSVEEATASPGPFQDSSESKTNNTHPRLEEEERINRINIENRIPKDPFRHLKRGYLFMYNLVQFLGFSWIFVNMTVRLFMLGKDSFFDTFHATSDMMYLCQTLAVMEIVNALIGLVRAPLVPILLQVFGRNFILFVVLGGVEEMQSKAVVFFVFYIWSLVEIFRYPFYMLSCLDIEWKVLTWIRYSIWIPLYPLGILAEAVTVIQAIPVFSNTGRFGLTLPSPLGFTVPFSLVLQLYLVALFLGPFVNFRHLYKQRKRHLGPKKRKTH
ncbi:PREDICTED: very-long-chain (3R)-3-hydroxyacyl-CoA dehydratase 3 [Gekko japonicus]|uniref:Very-long-chain (3R)-3-hydroxyacyl-CoA dehydratase n=1 Tax=Gekko japonicus TaxID=146911 RepID=A0ABM1L9I3_GEKJA|nr:PREDICTED: very-long-chain (3R)-3-hydroxyacyl-CoA dehydratase 3 [Gekko japonicus]